MKKPKLCEIWGIEPSWWYSVTDCEYDEIMVNPAGWALCRNSTERKYYYEMPGNMLSSLISHPERIKGDV